MINDLGWLIRVFGEKVVFGADERPMMIATLNLIEEMALKLKGVVQNG